MRAIGRRLRRFASSTYEGHGLWAMIGNVVLAMNSWYPLYWYWNLSRDQQPSFRAVAFFQVYFALTVTYSAYLFFELKHLLLKDGIADRPSKKAIAVFSAYGLFGLVSCIVQIWAALQMGLFVQTASVVAVLSLLASLGAAIGLEDIPLFLGVIFPPVVIPALVRIARSRSKIVLVLGHAGLIFVLVSAATFVLG